MRRTLALLGLALLAVTANAAVTGRVMDPDGKPLAGARVRAFAPETSHALLARLISDKPERTPVSTAETKADGTFTIDAKGLGVVTLLLDGPDSEWRSTEAVDGEEGLTVVLRTAKNVRGRVMARGKAIANALVVFGSDVVARSGEDGTFEFAPYSSEEPMRFFVIHPDYAPWDGFDRGEKKGLYDIELQSGIVLTGRVLAADGKTPVAGAIVRAGSWPLARSGEDGTYRIAHVMAPQSLTAIDGMRLGITPFDRKKASHDIVLRPGASVSGTVRSVKDDRIVPGARVSVQSQDVRAQFTAISDARGNFTIAPLPAVSGTLFVQHPAYSLLPPPFVELGEGERATQSLALTPFGRLRGTVVDEQRRPVPGARVSVMIRPGSAITGPDGTFVLRTPNTDRPLNVVVSKRGYGAATEGPVSVPMGETKSVQITLRKGFRFEVTLVDADGKPVAGEPLLLNRWADPSDRQAMVSIVCTEGEPAVCNMTDESGRRAYEILDGKYDVVGGGRTTLQKTVSGQLIDARTPPMTVQLQRGVIVSGRVVDADDNPVENALITTMGRGGFPRTDSTGAFSMANLETGATLSLTAQTVGGLSSDPVAVTAPAADVVLRLPRPARIEGRVFDRDSKQPLRDFSVAIVRDRRAGGPSLPRKFTPDDGRFVLEEVTPGDLDLAVQAKGYAPGGIVDVKTNAGGTTTVEVALDRGAILKGRVTSSGQPVSDVQINVSTQGSMTRGVRPQPPMRTDASGEFTIDGIAGGTQRVEFRKKGYAPLSKTFEVASGQETRADVELTRGRALQGRVVDESGQAIPNAEVSIQSAPGWPPARTDADGAFSIEGLGDQTYFVTARKEGYTTTVQEVKVAQTPSITLTLSRGASLSGRVLGIAPADLPLVEVSAYNGPLWRSTTSPDATGNFVLQGVPDGPVAIRAMQPRPVRRQSEAKTVHVVNGAAPFVQLDFNAGIAVRGRVTRNGVPVEGVVTFGPSRAATTPGPSSGASAQIGVDGMYEVRLSEPGEYEVRANVTGSARFGFGSMHKVSVTSSMTHDFEVKGATLRGRVVDERTGEPIAGATVEFRMQSHGGPPAITDSDGRFSFDALRDDKYFLRARRDRSVSESMEIVVRDGFVPEVEVRLRQTVAIGVRVVDANDGSVLEPSISLQRKDVPAAAEGAPVTRAENGGHRLWAMPGTYAASIGVNGYAPKTVDVTVPGPDLHVTMERAGTIVVTGVVPGASMLRLHGPGKRVVAIPPIMGRFGGLAAGVYKLDVVDAQKQVLETRDNITVTAGQTTTVTLR